MLLEWWKNSKHKWNNECRIWIYPKLQNCRVKNSYWSALLELKLHASVSKFGTIRSWSSLPPTNLSTRKWPHLTSSWPLNAKWKNFLNISEIFRNMRHSTTISQTLYCFKIIVSLIQLKQQKNWPFSQHTQRTAWDRK